MEDPSAPATQDLADPAGVEPGLPAAGHCPAKGCIRHHSQDTLAVGKFKAPVQLIVHILHQICSPDHAALLSSGQRVENWGVWNYLLEMAADPKSPLLQKLLKAWKIPDYEFVGAKVTKAFLSLEGLPEVALALLPVCSVSLLTTYYMFVVERWSTVVFRTVCLMRSAHTAAAAQGTGGPPL